MKSLPAYCFLCHRLRKDLPTLLILGRFAQTRWLILLTCTTHLDLPDTGNAGLNLLAINAKYKNPLKILIQYSRDSAFKLEKILTAVVHVQQVIM